MGKAFQNTASSARMADRHQDRVWKSQLTAAKIQGLSLSVSQRSLNRGRDFVTNLFACSLSFDQARVTQDTEMMGGVGLRAPEFLHKVRHAFFTDKQGFQYPQSRFIAQCLENHGALARGRHFGI